MKHDLGQSQRDCLCQSGALLHPANRLEAESRIASSHADTKWLTINGEGSPAAVRSEFTGGLALVVSRHLHGTVDQGERSSVFLHADLHVLALLKLLAVEVPGYAGFRIAGKVALKSGLHPRFHALLAAFLDELGRLFLV